MSSFALAGVIAGYLHRGLGISASWRIGMRGYVNTPSGRRILLGSLPFFSSS